MSRKVCLKSTKNLYLRHRFFNKIRQIHRLFNVFRQNLQILFRNQAPLGIRQTSSAAWRETPSTSSAYAQETRHPHEMDAGLKSLATRVRTVSARGSRVIRTWFTRNSYVVLLTWFNAIHAKTLPREDAQEGLQVGLSRMLRA